MWTFACADFLMPSYLLSKLRLEIVIIENINLTRKLQIFTCALIIANIYHYIVIRHFIRNFPSLSPRPTRYRRRLKRVVVRYFVVTNLKCLILRRSL